MTLSSSYIARPTGSEFLSVAARSSVLGVGLALSLVFATHAAGLIAAWPITYPEGAHVAAMLRVRADEPLYQDFRQFPFLITPYPPIMYLLGGLLSRTLDLSAFQTMIMARVVTLITCLTTAGLVYACARTAGTSRLAALVGASMLLSLPLLDQWAYAVRPDFPAVALSLFAALVLLRYPDRPKTAAALAVLAFFVKQSAVAFPVAATLWLWFDGRRGAASRFATTWAGLTLAGLLLMHVLTNGNHELNVIIAHLNPTIAMEFALQRFMHLPQLGWLPVGLAVVAVVAEAVRHRQLGLASTYWIVAIAVALFTVRGSGADVNYLIESAALACILASTSIDRLWRLDGARGWRASGAVLLAGATLAWGSSVWQEWQTWKGAPEQIGHWSYRAPLDRSLPLHEVAQADSVLAEEPTMVLLAGKRVVVSDPYHLSMLESAGRFDPTELAELIRRGTFDLIVLQGDARRRRGWAVPFWPEKVRQAIRDHYVLTSRNDIFWLYAPAAQPARRIGPQPDSRPFDTTPVKLTATPVTPSSPNSP